MRRRCFQLNWPLLALENGALSDARIVLRPVAKDTVDALNNLNPFSDRLEVHQS